MCGSMPLAHCASNSVSSSVCARAWSYQERPIAMNAESQLHWCGYRLGEGTVELPTQSSSSTALQASSSSASSARVSSLAWVSVIGSLPHLQAYVCKPDVQTAFRPH